MAIYFEHFVGAIVDHGIAGRRATIARDQDAAGEFESENSGRFRWNEGMTANGRG